MKLIGPYASPGVVHEVRLKDGTTVDALMTMGRRDHPDGTWITCHNLILPNYTVITDEIAEVIGTRMHERKSTEGLLMRQ